MRPFILLRSLLVLLPLGLTTIPIAEAQSVRPTTLVVPFAPGGPTDLVGRLVARTMSEQSGRPMVVENIGGAGAAIGTARVAKAQPDGHTLLLGNIGHAIAPSLSASLPFHPVDDFEPIGLVVDVPMVLVGRKGLPARNARELVDYLRRNPGTVSIGHAGIGVSSHVCALLLESIVQVKLISVPYKGTAPAMNDLLSGHLDLLCDQVTTAGAQISAGTVTAFGLTTKSRSPALPDVPTLAESGLPGVDLAVWHGLYAPKGTPQPVIAALSQALREVVSKDEVAMRLAELGAMPVPAAAATPQALREKLNSEITRWAPIIKNTASLTQ